jgi:hypothetical protein
VLENSVFLLKNDSEILSIAEKIDTSLEIEHISTQIQELSLQQLKILLKTHNQ